MCDVLRPIDSVQQSIEQRLKAVDPRFGNIPIVPSDEFKKRIAVSIIIAW